MELIEVQQYLALLGELAKCLAQLTMVEQEKINAVRQDDLVALNDCLKQEQVLSLGLRGFDQKRQATLNAWHLSDLPLSRLASALPEAFYGEAKAASEELLRQYELFRGVFEIAQNTLECNLHEIEKQLQQLGVSPEAEPGFQAADPQLPTHFRTDFRA